MADYVVIKTDVIPQVTEVRLYDETVEKVRDGHPEVPAGLPSMEAAVQSTVVNPTHVESSHSNTYVYVDAGTTNASGDPLRVPVKVVDGTAARVKSFYFATTDGERNSVWRRG